jgi:hypothetical protein
MIPREWCKFVLLQKIVHTHAKQLRHKADMVSMVEPM